MKRFILIACLFTCVDCVSAQQPDTIVLPVENTPKAADLKQKKAKLNVELPPVGDSSLATPPPKRIRSSLFYRFFVEKYPNPRAAALLGIFPGGGQVYNRKWWKLPLVYGALGGMGWWAISTDQQYRKLRDNYKWVVDGDDNTNPFEAPYTLMSTSQLKGYRDLFRSYTEKRYLWFGVTYLLSITDAFVDAHLSRFDVSDDLSLRFIPAIQSGANGFGPSFGIGIQLGLGKP